MKLINALVVAALALVAAAEDVPFCSSGCFNETFPKVGCGQLDEVCQCVHNRDIITILVTPCIVANCTPEEVQLARKATDRICSKGIDAYSKGIYLTDGPAQASYKSYLAQQSAAVPAVTVTVDTSVDATGQPLAPTGGSATELPLGYPSYASDSSVTIPAYGPRASVNSSTASTSVDAPAGSPTSLPVTTATRASTLASAAASKTSETPAAQTGAGVPVHVILVQAAVAAAGVAVIAGLTV